MAEYTEKDDKKKVSKEESAAKQQETLAKLVGYFESFDKNTQSDRNQSEICRDFYDGKQWTDEEERKIKARRQPVVTYNRIKPKVDRLRGLERDMRTDPKAFPRTPMHEQDADAVTDSIRYVTENNQFDFVRSDVFENMLIEGTGAVEVHAKKCSDGKKEIKISLIPWDRFIYDEHSRQRNYKDAAWMGIVVWMDKEDAQVQYKDKAEQIEQLFSESSGGDTFEDRPKWVSSDRSRMRVIQMYYLEDGKWMYAQYTDGVFLVGPQESPYKDEMGDPACGIIAQSAYIDRDNRRYGVVDGYLDPQREINKRRSKALHLMTMRQTVGEEGAVDDVAEMKRQLADPQGHVTVTPGKRFELLDHNDMTQHQMNMLQEAKNEIDQLGYQPAMGDTPQENVSGRALLVQEARTQKELQPVFDGLREWQLRVYRAVWDRIVQFWTEERWIRVTDDEKNLKWVGLNRKIKVADVMQQEFGEQLLPEVAQHPMMQAVAGVENELSKIDVDIILEDAPDVATLRSEQFEMMARIAQSQPGSIPTDLLIEMSSLPHKDQVLEKLRGNEEQQMQNQQKQQMVDELQMRGVQAQTMLTEAEAQAAQASAMQKQMDALKKQYEAAKIQSETGLTEAQTAQTVQDMYIPADKIVDIR